MVCTARERNSELGIVCFDTRDNPHFLAFARDRDAAGSRTSDIVQEALSPVVDETNIDRVREYIDKEASFGRLG